MSLSKALNISAASIRRRGLLGIKDIYRSYLSLLRQPPMLSSRPLFIQIEPTLYCNLKCNMCMNPTTERVRRHMTLDQFKRILSQIPTLSKVSLVGAGEPLLNPELFEMIKYAKSKGISIGFATNGMLLDDHNCQKISDTIPDWINISVDSADKEKFESIRPGADFNLLTENIRRLKRIGQKNRNLDISIWLVLMNDNLSELPSLIKYSSSVGVTKVCAQMQHNWGDTNNKKPIPNEKGITEILKEALQTAKDEGVTFDYVNIPDATGKRSCKWPWKASYITAEGFITPCCLHGANPQVINFGNINQTSFDHLWNNQAYQDFRIRLKSEDPPDICKGCTAYYEKVRL